MSIPEVEVGGDAARAGQAALALLLCEGAVVLRGAASGAAVLETDLELADAFAATPFSRGGFYGDRTVRFGRILHRSPTFRRLAVGTVAYEIAAAALGRWHRAHCLSFAQGIAIHPGSPAQVPHRDGEMWPVSPTEAEHLVSVMWPLTRFDARNGGTMVWCGSHRAGESGDAGDPSVPEMEPGDALVFLGTTRHAGGANRSHGARRGIVAGYAAAWLVPAENPILAYPPEIARTFPPELAGLVGYRRYAPNLNNYDCRCPSELLDEGGAGSGAVDELFPEQVEGLRRLRELAEAAA